ncbi:MAG: hypothetical protein ACRDQ4_27545 [Pseudonocardiaceae bacterium]
MTRRPADSAIKVACLQLNRSQAATTIVIISTLYLPETAANVQH